MTQEERWIWRIPMDVHRAGPQDLSRIDGIGCALASRICGYVGEKKCLQSLDELLDVPGIGRSRLEKLKEELELR
jgi:competence protein ComEA